MSASDPAPSHTAHPTLPALLSSLRPHFPQGSDNTPIPAAASTGEAALSETATELQAIGMDALEIAKYPDFPSFFERINAMQTSLEQIAALLSAAQPKVPLYEVAYIGVEGSGLRVNKHGRRYLGLRSQATPAPAMQVRTGTGIQSVTLATAYTFLILPDTTSIFAKTSADAGNIEIVYLDEIPGNALIA